MCTRSTATAIADQQVTALERCVTRDGVCLKCLCTSVNWLQQWLVCFAAVYRQVSAQLTATAHETGISSRAACQSFGLCGEGVEGVGAGERGLISWVLLPLSAASAHQWHCSYAVCIHAKDHTLSSLLFFVWGGGGVEGWGGRSQWQMCSGRTLEYRHIRAEMQY